MKNLLPTYVPGVVFCVVFAGCQNWNDPLHRIHVLENEYLEATSRTQLLADHLYNPASPRSVGDTLVFAESGAGAIHILRNGKPVPVITGFVKDQFSGYDISALGITIDPKTGVWIIAVAEGPGKIQVFDPASLPMNAKDGYDIPLEGATEDNPFGTVLIDGILVASGGTKSAYQGPFDPSDPSPLKPVFEVDSGLIGIALDPISGDIFGALFGKKPGEGSVVRWNPKENPVTLRTVASGFTNLVDVAFTKEGMLLALEFGSYAAAGSGRVSIVDTDKKVIPFIIGLDSPTGLHVSPDNTLFITEFGTSVNAREGTLISLKLEPKR